MEAQGCGKVLALVRGTGNPAMAFERRMRQGTDLQDLCLKEQGRAASRFSMNFASGFGHSLLKTWKREDRAMKMECLSCSCELDLDQQIFSVFNGSIKCSSCGAAMEIQTMMGVLIWAYLLSGMNPDFADRQSEDHLYAGQKKL